jgi:hypothetical protein
MDVAFEIELFILPHDPVEIGINDPSVVRCGTKEENVEKAEEHTCHPVQYFGESKDIECILPTQGNRCLDNDYLFLNLGGDARIS